MKTNRLRIISALCSDISAEIEAGDNAGPDAYGLALTNLDPDVEDPCDVLYAMMDASTRLTTLAGNLFHEKCVGLSYVGPKD